MGPEREILERVAADGEDRDRPLASPLAYDVWLHDIRGGHNVGSVMRIVDAMGLGAVHRSGFTPGPDVAAVRAAAIAARSVAPVVVTSSITRTRRPASAATRTRWRP